MTDFDEDDFRVQLIMLADMCRRLFLRKWVWKLSSFINDPIIDDLRAQSAKVNALRIQRVQVAREKST